MKLLVLPFLCISLSALSQESNCFNAENTKYTGFCVETYKSGAKRKEVNYKDGFIHDEYQEYYENGALMAKAKFFYGTLIDSAYRYFPDSTVQVAIEMDGSGTGTFKEFGMADGRVLREGSIKRNYRNGTWTDYNWNGEVHEELQFNADSLIDAGNRTETTIIFQDETIGEVFLVEYGMSTEISDEVIVEFPDVEAKFKGGQSGLQKYIGSSIRYPDKAIDKDISGKIYLSFVVEIDGSVSNVKVERGAHPLLDAEALRVVRKMPKWNPAIANGKNVRSRCRLPIVFTLTGPAKKPQTQN